MWVHLTSAFILLPRCFDQQRMAMTAYTYQAQAMMKDYLLADPLVPYTSVLIGVLLCKMVILSTLSIS
jgi:hypothetical protein